MRSHRQHGTGGSAHSARRRARRAVATVVVAVLALGALASVPATASSEPGPGVPTATDGRARPALPSDAGAAIRAGDVDAQRRIPAPKALDVERAPNLAPDTIQVKLAEGTGIRLRGGRLVGPDGESVPALDAVLARFPGTTVERLFTAPEQELDRTQQQREQQSGREQADLNAWLRMRTVAGQDVTLLAEALNALDIVETAYLEELPRPNPVSPSFVGYQGYRGATFGIDAEYANTLTGGRGEYVRIVDIEYGWNRTHEDLSRLRAAGSDIQVGTPYNPFDDNHGTAVIGEIAGDPNGFGVTGLAPGAWIGTVNQRSTSGDQRANAIYRAAQLMSPGDVMLLEMQTTGPLGACGADQVGCVAVEWVPAIYDAIVSATSKGIIVVEAAGNGHQNLDHAAYGTTFPQGRADSGAIIVGAGGAGMQGCSTARTRLDFSNHGRRVDVQAWGQCVATTGYGNLQGGDRNAWYTAGFGGTSSASPIVASAAAIVSSIAEARGVSLTPRDVRAILKSTGRPQTAGLSGNIGPLPNLRAAIAAIGGGGGSETVKPAVKVPVQLPAKGGKMIPANTVPVSIQWSATDASGIAEYSVYTRTNGGAWTPLALASATAKSKVIRTRVGSTYQVAVAAKDRAGNWSDWAYGPTFEPGVWEESSQYVSYSTGWKLADYAPASGGAVKWASVPGTSASFTFTGRAVGWVASRSTNRGQARIYIDGVLRDTVDLYSPTTIPATVVRSFAWANVGTHTIRVVTVGTAGRPKIDVDSFTRLR